WLGQRRDLAVRTNELYRYLLDKYILGPERSESNGKMLGEIPLSRFTPSIVAAWHAELAMDHKSTAAKSYRLLSQIMRAAVADNKLGSNSCQVRGGGVERAAERPTATFAEVAALAEAMPEHLQIAVYLAAWCQLRRGEILGLRRKDIDLMHGTLSISVTRTETMAGVTVEKAPKTEAGRRSIAIPPNVVPHLTRHLGCFVAPDTDAWVMIGEFGGPLRPQVLSSAWSKARAEVGRSDLHLHDLRHSGLTWAAATGATVAELMRRAGHASPAAAMRYQHATEDRDRVLADALADFVKGAEIVNLKSLADTTRTEAL
ncbi:MAG: tyrosine-type recombinase/integrase, partial [Acidimicrobiales bacterium]